MVEVVKRKRVKKFDKDVLDLERRKIGVPVTEQVKYPHIFELTIEELVKLEKAK